MKSCRCRSVDLEVAGGQVVDQGRHGASLAEQGPVGLELTAVADGLTSENANLKIVFISYLGQLCPRLVIPCLRELGQLVDHAVVGDHGEVLLVPRDVSDGEADGREDLFIDNISHIPFEHNNKHTC